MLLPADKARHVGEAVAMVVADTLAQALDAAEAVEVEYEELPCVYHSEDAMKPGAPAAVGRGARTTCWSTPRSATATRPTAASRPPITWWRWTSTSTGSPA